MSEEQWVSLSSEEFDQLQKYSEYSSKKIKDVLAEFNEGGSLRQYDPHKNVFYPPSFPLFRAQFMETYWTNKVTDSSAELTREEAQQT